MPRLIQALPDGPLDIVGDVHGEIEPLLALLHRLGVDPDRRRAERPVVFVGDLVDRGPDSVAVVELYAHLRDAGIAHAVLGNHELNLLADDKKEGNGWYFGDAADHAQHQGAHIPFASRLATPSDRVRIRDVLADLPLVLTRPDLRVVHAAWNDEAAAALPESADAATLCASLAVAIDADLAERGVPEQAAWERARFSGLRIEGHKPDVHLPAVVEADVAHQARNPVKLLTSGAEVPLPPGQPVWVGGKWRFVTRDRWWLRPAGRPTVVGHYWRRRGPPIPGKLDVWGDVAPFAWSNDVYCVDYSVGRRYLERHRGRRDTYDGGLAALRWPERLVVFDDRDRPIPTADAP